MNAGLLDPTLIYATDNNEVFWLDAQTLFKEGNSQGTPIAEDNPQS